MGVVQNKIDIKNSKVVYFNSVIEGELNEDNSRIILNETRKEEIKEIADFIYNNINTLQNISLILDNEILGYIKLNVTYVNGGTGVYRNLQAVINVINLNKIILNIDEGSIMFLDSYNQYLIGSKLKFIITI